MKLRSLLYHDVIEDNRYHASGFPGEDANLYKLTRALFREHLRALAEGPAEVVRVSDVLSEVPEGQEDAVTLTIDDGGISGLSVADDLEEHGMRGHFFVTTDYIGTPGFLDVPHIRDLHARGHVIGTHSRTHPPMISRCSPDRLKQEWAGSVAALENILGSAVTTGSIPGGFYSSRVSRAAEESGIRLLFTSEPTSRRWSVGACQLLGRYSVIRTTSASAALSLASGDAGPCARQWLAWNAKKGVKKVAGPLYVAFRKAFFASKVSSSLEQTLSEPMAECPPSTPHRSAPSDTARIPSRTARSEDARSVET